MCYGCLESSFPRPSVLLFHLCHKTTWIPILVSPSCLEDLSTPLMAFITLVLLTSSDPLRSKPLRKRDPQVQQTLHVHYRSLSDMADWAGRKVSMCACVCLKNSDNKRGPSPVQMLMPNLCIVTSGFLKISHLPKAGHWQNIRPKIITQLWTCYLLSYKSSQTKISYFINDVLFMGNPLLSSFCLQ